MRRRPAGGAPQHAERRPGSELPCTTHRLGTHMPCEPAVNCQVACHAHTAASPAVGALAPADMRVRPIEPSRACGAPMPSLPPPQISLWCMLHREQQTHTGGQQRGWQCQAALCTPPAATAARWCCPAPLHALLLASSSCSGAFHGPLSARYASHSVDSSRAAARPTVGPLLLHHRHRTASRAATSAMLAPQRGCLPQLRPGGALLQPLAARRTGRTAATRRPSVRVASLYGGAPGGAQSPQPGAAPPPLGQQLPPGAPPTGQPRRPPPPNRRVGAALPPQPAYPMQPGAPMQQPPMMPSAAGMASRAYQATAAMAGGAAAAELPPTPVQQAAAGLAPSGAAPADQPQYLPRTLFMGLPVITRCALLVVGAGSGCPLCSPHGRMESLACVPPCRAPPAPPDCSPVCSPHLLAGRRASGWATSTSCTWTPPPCPSSRSTCASRPAR